MVTFIIFCLGIFIVFMKVSSYRVCNVWSSPIIVSFVLPLTLGKEKPLLRKAIYRLLRGFARIRGIGIGKAKMF